MVEIKNKVAIITGASSGIGAATSEYFASLGCNLSLADINDGKLNDTKMKCLNAGLETSQILCTKADVTNIDELKYLVEDTVKKFGKLDILINCAGVACFGGLSSSPIEDYDKIMAINVRSILLLTKLCIPHLEKVKGTIVNVSSIAGYCPRPEIFYYCMSKAAIDQLTKCLSLELAHCGIRVNAVNPSTIVTELFKSGGMTEEQFVVALEKNKKGHPLGRNGQTIEVAKSIGFLASDDSSFTTGHLLNVDGGRAIWTP